MTARGPPLVTCVLSPFLLDSEEREAHLLPPPFQALFSRLAEQERMNSGVEELITQPQEAWRNRGEGLGWPESRQP